MLPLSATDAAAAASMAPPSPAHPSSESPTTADRKHSPLKTPGGAAATSPTAAPSQLRLLVPPSPTQPLKAGVSPTHSDGNGSDASGNNTAASSYSDPIPKKSKAQPLRATQPSAVKTADEFKTTSLNSLTPKRPRRDSLTLARERQLSSRIRAESQECDYSFYAWQTLTAILTFGSLILTGMSGFDVHNALSFFEMLIGMLGFGGFATWFILNTNEKGRSFVGFIQDSLPEWCGLVPAVVLKMVSDGNNLNQDPFLRVTTIIGGIGTGHIVAVSTHRVPNKYHELQQGTHSSNVLINGNPARVLVRGWSDGVATIRKQNYRRWVLANGIIGVVCLLLGFYGFDPFGEATLSLASYLLNTFGFATLGASALGPIFSAFFPNNPFLNRVVGPFAVAVMLPQASAGNAVLVYFAGGGIGYSTLTTLYDIIPLETHMLRTQHQQANDLRNDVKGVDEFYEDVTEQAAELSQTCWSNTRANVFSGFVAFGAPAALDYVFDVMLMPNGSWSWNSFAKYSALTTLVICYHVLKKYIRSDVLAEALATSLALDVPAQEKIRHFFDFILFRNPTPLALTYPVLLGRPWLYLSEQGALNEADKFDTAAFHVYTVLWAIAVVQRAERRQYGPLPYLPEDFMPDLRKKITVAAQAKSSPPSNAAVAPPNTPASASQQPHLTLTVDDVTVELAASEIKIFARLISKLPPQSHQANTKRVDSNVHLATPTAVELARVQVVYTPHTPNPSPQSGVVHVAPVPTKELTPATSAAAATGESGTFTLPHPATRFHTYAAAGSLLTAATRADAKRSDAALNSAAATDTPTATAMTLRQATASRGALMPSNGHSGLYVRIGLLRKPVDTNRFNYNSPIEPMIAAVALGPGVTRALYPILGF